MWTPEKIIYSYPLSPLSPEAWTVGEMTQTTLVSIMEEWERSSLFP